MKVVNATEFENTEFDVQFTGGHSFRMAKADEGLGFSVNKTFVPASEKAHLWNYKNHKEACYCISGEGIVTNEETGEQWQITVDSLYMLPNNEKMSFLPISDCVLISIFNPPLTGKETHDANGSYEGKSRIEYLAEELKREISLIESVDEKIKTLNYVRGELHEVSPLKHHPVDYVTWQKSTEVEANEYNPNKIPPPELELLHKSISEDGYTMPIVAFNSNEGIKIVDGFHRRLMEQIHEDISGSTFGYVPASFIRKSQEQTGDRMASTIRHNRARGVHNIELMSTIVAELVEMGKGDRWICQHIGMSSDELLRLKQITCLASLFTNKEFSMSWEPVMSKDGKYEIEEN
jgi:quercetin dioxygenase-like cupin family protein